MGFKFSLIYFLLCFELFYTFELEFENSTIDPLDIDPILTIKVHNGWILGRKYEGFKREVVGFLGIPYAQPPIAEKRFKAPLPALRWSGILNATDFGPMCWQPGEQKIYDAVMLRNRSTLRKRKLENYHMDENCLSLNVYVPQTILNSQGYEKVPVLFYIHGGSYYMGGGRLYPGQILPAFQNIIVVTFNFRLGPLGFLSTEDLSATGNWGLLDQSLALDWVHDNIAFFGGDPAKVTIVGNSAGGASAMFHLVSPLSRGKFSAVTVQSGCSAAPWSIQYKPRKHAVALAAKLGCPTQPTLDLVECIRTFQPKTILKNANLEDGLSLAYAVVIDGNYGGRFLSAHPDDLIKSNQFLHVPVLGGFTKDEVTIWFTKWGPSAPVKHLRDFLHHDVLSLIKDIPGLTPANHAAAFHAVKIQYMGRYNISDNHTLGKTLAVSDFISDVGLKAPCIQELNLLASMNTQPVYLYEFSYYSVDDLRMNRQEWIGSYHESELQFIFGETYLNYSNHLRAYDDKKISDLMMNLWTNFAKYGSPTAPGGERLKFKWTNYTETNPDYAVLGLKSHMKKYFYTDRMLFWNYFFPIFRDYEFVFDGDGDTSCTNWEWFGGNWIFWVSISILTVLLSSFPFIIHTFRQKIVRKRRRGQGKSCQCSNINSTTQ